MFYINMSSKVNQGVPNVVVLTRERFDSER